MLLIHKERAKNNALLTLTGSGQLVIYPFMYIWGKAQKYPNVNGDHLHTSCPKPVTHNANLIKFTLRITALSMWWPALVGYVYCTKFTSFVLTAFTHIHSTQYTVHSTQYTVHSTQLQRNRISITSAMPYVCDSGQLHFDTLVHTFSMVLFTNFCSVECERCFPLYYGEQPPTTIPT